MSKHQGNAERARSPVVYTNTSGMSITASDVQGRAFLASLVGFIRPHIDAYASVVTGTTDFCQAHVDFDSTAERVCSEVQGQELLSALGRFIKELTANAGITKEVIEESKTPGDKSTEGQEPIPVQQHVLTVRPSTAQNLSQTIINQVHQHVFNEMPIRMLAFDSNGMQLRLIGRSEIAEEIKSRISDLKNWQRLDESKSLDLVKELGRYAILSSHTWFRGKPGDVVYDEWNKRELNARGNSKIIKFCEVAARNHGVTYGWMDTVCIDKSSSTELDESIRSMYRWYRQSHVCITYLADTSEILDIHSDVWFTRGWTLQELLAPQNMVFYSRTWIKLTQNGKAKNDTGQGGIRLKFRTFPDATQSQIIQATSIERDELRMCFENPALLPISRVFQLASRRNVTREEDRVYSLMGLVGVSISVAYGEGLPAALKRLVREIMVAKELFLDVFNHSNRKQLIPSSITEYEKRSSLFDQTSFRSPTELHRHTPIEPISMTHLGVHVPILLVPLFRRPITGAPLSSGTHPHTVSIRWLESYNYYVLKHNAISAKFIAGFPKAKLTTFPPDVTFCGILNFRKSGSVYRMSNRWLYVSFVLGSGYTPNLITGVDARDLEQVSGPLVQSWPSEHSLGYEEIREQDLQKMGMQVTTLYLL